MSTYATEWPGLSVLEARLARLRALLRAAMCAVGLGRLLFAAAAWAALDLGLDRWLHLSQSARAASLGACVVLLARLAFGGLLRPLVRPLPARQLALEVERRRPGADDLFASALALREDGGASGLARLTALSAEREAAALDPSAFVDWRPARRWLGLALVLWAALAAGAAGWPGTASLWFSRGVLLRPVEWPLRTRLTLEPFRDLRLVVARGSDVTVTVRAQGVIPATARLALSGERQGSRAIVLARTGRAAYATTLPNVTETTSVVARAGDARTEPHEVIVTERPAVADAGVTVDPPAYLGGGPVELPWTAPRFDVPAGSRLTVRLTATKPLSAAEWSAGGEAGAMQLLGPDRALAVFDVTGDGTYAFSLRDRDGIGSAEPFTMDVRAVPDRPPAVRFTAEGVGATVTAAAVVPLRAEATDDYAVTEARLAVQAGAAAWPDVVLWQGPGQAQVVSEHALDLGDLGLEAGDRVVVQCSARDNREPEPGVTAAPSLRLQVVTPAQLLRSLLVRQEDLRRDLEHLIGVQRDVLRRAPDAQPPAEDLVRQERSLAAEMGRLADAYALVLAELRNNGLLDRAAWLARTGQIVGPLRALSGPEGAAARAAVAFERGDASAVALARSALDAMGRVRTAMLLIEGDQALKAAVEEIGVEQQRVLDETRRRATGQEDGP